MNYDEHWFLNIQTRSSIFHRLPYLLTPSIKFRVFLYLIANSIFSINFNFVHKKCNRKETTGNSFFSLLLTKKVLH